MKVIFDTVVLVRGLIDPFSWSGKLLFDWPGTYEWVISPEIAKEYLDVLNRPRLSGRFLAHENRDLNKILELMSHATVVNPPRVPVVSRDPCDDKFLAAAEFCGADYLVSEDNDLLSLSVYEGTRICTPVVVLRELGQADR